MSKRVVPNQAFLSNGNWIPGYHPAMIFQVKWSRLLNNPLAVGSKPFLILQGHRGKNEAEVLINQ
jgi:hypothetical protein